jgi:hypothetical protein
MHKIILAQGDIVKLYQQGTPIKELQALSGGVSRTAIYNVLAEEPKRRREVLSLQCKFCHERYEKPRSHIRGTNGGYCSVQCFHASRSICGAFSPLGDSVARINVELETANRVTDRQLGRRAVAALQAAGVRLKQGEVVHHRDGDRRNFDINNLQVFKSQAEHMQFHHSIRQR